MAGTFVETRTQGMMMEPVVVGVPANFLQDLHLHAVSNRYLQTIVTHARAVPLIIPCLATMARGSGFSAPALVTQLDGLVLTGSRSNVHPRRYGAIPNPQVTSFDESRDATVFPLIHAAVEEGIPIFCICRGMQELNCAFGGTLHQAVHDVPGKLDHRAARDIPQHLKYFPAHDIVPVPGGWLDTAIKERGLRLPDLKMNTLHGQAIEDLGTGLKVEARAPDGIVEAISLPTARAWTFGVQWHPEWHTEEVPLNKLLFEAFSLACAQRRELRLPNAGVRRTRSQPTVWYGEMGEHSPIASRS